MLDRNCIRSLLEFPKVNKRREALSVYFLWIDIYSFPPSQYKKRMHGWACTWACIACIVYIACQGPSTGPTRHHYGPKVCCSTKHYRSFCCLQRVLTNTWSKKACLFALVKYTKLQGCVHILNFFCCIYIQPPGPNLKQVDTDSTVGEEGAGDLLCLSVGG